jgi:hypothetical protein
LDQLHFAVEAFGDPVVANEVLFISAHGMSKGAIIASDSFLTGGSPAYTTGFLYDQNPTSGSSGFSARWNFQTSAVTAHATGLSHPLVSNPEGSTNNGGLYVPGNANTRTQRRPLATYTTTGSDYYFSGLMSSSAATFSAGAARFGLSSSSGDTVPPTAGIQVGFTSGGNISVFYKDAMNTYTSSTVTTYVAGMTYQFVVHLTTATSLADVSIFDSSGALVGSLTGIATTTNVGTDFTNISVGATSEFNSGSPSQIRFDEFRFGTALADVTVPEPSLAVFSGLGLLAIAAKRRR